MHASASMQRALIWLSVASLMIYGLGFWLTGFIPPPSPSRGISEVIELYSAHNLKFRIGVVICLVSAAFALPWSVAVSIQMARHEKGIPGWSILQVLAGVMGTLIFMAPALFWGVAAFSVDRDPALTLMMHELSFLALVTPPCFFIFQVLPIAVIGLSRKDDRDSAFPRWLGYVTVWMMLCAEVGVMAQLFKSGPFAWNGVFTFWIPLIMFLVWYTTINVTMFRAISIQERATIRAHQTSRRELNTQQ